MKNRSTAYWRLALALAFLALAACTTAVRNDAAGSSIKQRAVQRWDFLIAHQADKAYDYLSPGYRSTISRESYAQRMDARGVRWSKVHFNSQKCETGVCHVYLTVDYTLHIGGPTGSVKSTGFVVETWVRADGQWYFLPDALGPSKLGGSRHS